MELSFVVMILKDQKLIQCLFKKINLLLLDHLINFRKINDEVIEVWSSILKKVKIQNCF